MLTGQSYGSQPNGANAPQPLEPPVTYDHQAAPYYPLALHVNAARNQHGNSLADSLLMALSVYRSSLMGSLEDNIKEVYQTPLDEPEAANELLTGETAVTLSEIYLVSECMEQLAHQLTEALEQANERIRQANAEIARLKGYA